MTEALSLNNNDDFDFLSNLPQEILRKIIEFLNLKFIIKIMTLSELYK